MERSCYYCRSKPWFASGAHTHWPSQCSHLKKLKRTVCSNCGERGHRSSDCAPRLRELDVDCSMATHFRDKWRHPDTELDEIHAVFGIRCGAKMRDAFYESRRRVKQKMRRRGDEDPADEEHIGPANTRQRFHGTGFDCGLLEESECCDGSECKVCSIVRTGFDLSRVGETSKGHRYGHGVYLTATSSKADDYAHMAQVGHAQYKRGGGNADDLKAVLVVQVVCGKVKQMLEADFHLRQPPPGYDSVVGLSPEHMEEEEDEYINPLTVTNALNYDELVVYDERRVLPVGLILYSGGRGGG